MTPNEIKKLRAKVQKPLEEKLKGLKEGTISIAELTSIESSILTMRRTITSRYLTSCNSPSDFARLLSDFECVIEELPIHIGGNYIYEPTTCYDDEDIDDNCIYYEYRIPVDSINPYTITAEVERIIAEDLRPPRASMTRTPSWNKVQDYVEGTITYDELVDHTYPEPNTARVLAPTVPRSYSWRS